MFSGFSRDFFKRGGRHPNDRNASNTSNASNESDSSNASLLSPHDDNDKNVMTQTTQDDIPDMPIPVTKKGSTVIGLVALDDVNATKDKTRCAHCNKRLGLIYHECKCGHNYCMAHRYDTVHQCSFDWKRHHQDQLAKNNPLVDATKVIRI